jgi:diguanylate cyclase (GGDEF)-like protein
MEDIRRTLSKLEAEFEGVELVEALVRKGRQILGAEPTMARSLFEQAHVHALHLDDPSSTAAAVSGLAEYYLILGNISHAQGLTEEAEGLVAEGDAATTAWVKLSVAEIALHSRRLDEASNALKAALTAAELSGDPDVIVSVHDRLGRLERSGGSFDQATASFQTVVDVLPDNDVRRVDALTNLAEVDAAQGQDPTPRLEEALRIAGEARDTGAQVRVLLSFARLRLDAGNYASALEYLREAEEVARDRGNAAERKAAVWYQVLAAMAARERTLAESALQALDRADDGVVPYYLLPIFSRLARFYAAVEGTAAATEIFERTDALYERAFTRGDAGPEAELPRFMGDLSQTLEEIHEAGRELGEAGESAEVLSSVGTAFRRVFGMPFFGFSVPKAEGLSPVLAVREGEAVEPEGGLQGDGSPQKSAADSGSVVIERGEGWTYAVPIAQGEAILGVVTLSGPVPVATGSIPAMSVLAAYAAAALQSHGGVSGLADREAVTAAIAEADTVTGFGTGRSFQRKLAEYWKLGRRLVMPLSLVMVGIDGLPDVLNRYGERGRETLYREVAGELKRSFRRDTDFVVRLEDDRFAALLLDTPLEPAVERAEAVKTRLDEKPMEVGGELLEYRLALGVAGEIPSGDDPAFALLDRGRAALADAFRTGKTGIRGEET